MKASCAAAQVRPAGWRRTARRRSRRRGSTRRARRAGPRQVALDASDHLVRERCRRGHVLVDNRLHGRILLRGIGLADRRRVDPQVERVVARSWFFALACTTSPDLSSRVSVMSVRIRPNDAALVTRRVTPPAVTVQRYSLCVWAETITLILGSRRWAILSMSLPARLPGTPVEGGRSGLLAALVDDEHPGADMLRILASGRWRVRCVGLVLEGQSGHAGRA